MSGDAARRSACATIALCAVGLVWLWQFATVRYNYGGEWTALFRICASMPSPDYLKAERFYVFHEGEGYDGQVYHLIAHDPWMQKGSREAIAGFSFRYQRIFVPALAWTIALGRDAWVDRAYYGVILGFVFLGVYWLGLITGRAGWGLAFLLTPAAIVSIDRMTVDIALAALVAGFAWFVLGRTATWRVAILLACAALTRETAVLIIAGYAVYLITKKRFGDAALIAAAALPALAWFVYLGREESSPVISYGTLGTAGGIHRTGDSSGKLCGAGLEGRDRSWVRLPRAGGDRDHARDGGSAGDGAEVGWAGGCAVCAGDRGDLHRQPGSLGGSRRIRARADAAAAVGVRGVLRTVAVDCAGADGAGGLADRVDVMAAG